MPRPLVLIAVLIAVACGREVVFVDPPPPSGGDTSSDTSVTDTTTVRRVDLVVTVTVAPEELSLAERVGLAGGLVPNAQVTARRVQGLQAAQSGTTDAQGRVTLPGLVEGAWAIVVLRPLNDAERALLDSADRDVTGFAGARRFAVSPDSTRVSVAVLAGRQGTLVFSEAYLPAVRDRLPIYELGQYLEVHNNSVDTLYLDGKIFGMSLPWVFPTSAGFTCELSAPWREDPEGIWTHYFWAFPGTGTTYPLVPGGSAVIAIDAIDHRPVAAQLLDLSGANFEFIGTDADVDNPAVPNMVEFPGFSDAADEIVGHGPWWSAVGLSVFLSEPFDPDSLVRDNLPVYRPLYVRVPRAKILDVLTSGYAPTSPYYTSGFYCPHFVHPSFDGQFAELGDESATHSVTRKALAGSPPDLRLLQRTKVSAVDWAHAPPTPGRAP